MDTATKKSNHGANVRRWREWRNINQDILAEQVGISQATLSGYEKREKLEPEVLEKIAKVLEIPVEAITELEQGAAINIISSTFNDTSAINNYYPVFNPIEKIMMLYEEKHTLYERMLKEKQDIISLLQEVLKEKE